MSAMDNDDDKDHDHQVNGLWDLYNVLGTDLDEIPTDSHLSMTLAFMIIFSMP